MIRQEERYKARDKRYNIGVENQWMIKYNYSKSSFIIV